MNGMIGCHSASAKKKQNGSFCAIDKIAKRWNASPPKKRKTNFISAPPSPFPTAVALDSNNATKLCLP